MNQDNGRSMRRPCPHCGANILVREHRCTHCGQDIVRASGRVLLSALLLLGFLLFCGVLYAASHWLR